MNKQYVESIEKKKRWGSLLFKCCPDEFTDLAGSETKSQLESKRGQNRFQGLSCDTMESLIGM